MNESNDLGWNLFYLFAGFGIGFMICGILESNSRRFDEAREALKHEPEFVISSHGRKLYAVANDGAQINFETNKEA